MDHQEENLPNASVRKTLKQLFGRSDYKLDLACAKGDNYLGVVWRIRVPDHCSFVLKLPPKNSVRRKQFFARPCFIREAVAYDQFLPLVKWFQEERNVPELQRFRHYPHCLATRQDEPNECIVLEDLCHTGYQMHDRFSELTTAHVSLAMCAYAKLHAVSLSIKNQQPQHLLPFQKLVDIFEQRRNDEALSIYFEQLKQSALDALCPQQDAIFMLRLQAYFGRGTYFELLSALLSSANCEPYAVVCHGDTWNNNLLYRCQEDTITQQPIDVRLIDWQLMRYASPITDLAYFLFSCTTQEFRRQHYKAMLQVYYNELSQQLTRLGEKADCLFPLTAFKKQWSEKGAVGLLLAMMVLPIVTMRGEDVPDLQVVSEHIERGGTTNLQAAGFLCAGNATLYKQRMRGVVLDCIEYNYI